MKVHELKALLAQCDDDAELHFLLDDAYGWSWGIDAKMVRVEEIAALTDDDDYHGGFGTVALKGDFDVLFNDKSKLATPYRRGLSFDLRT